MDYIIERLEVGDVNNCAYIIICKQTNKAICIDPAWDIEAIEKCIAKYNATLTTILLTHYHYDHTNLVIPLLEKYDCRVYISEEESCFYQYECANLNKVSDSEIIKIGSLEIECILTPGHTVGSLCYKLDNNLFTGDTVFIRSCGFCNCKGSDYNQMFDSIKKIKKLAQKGILIYPGHYFRDDYKYESEYLKRNIYFHINDKEVFKRFVTLSGERNIYLQYQ